MQAMEAFLSDEDSDMSLSNMTWNSQGSYMVTSSNEPPLNTSIRVNDDFDCIADDYLGLVKVGNVGVWFLIDSGSAVTFIRESDAKFVSRHSNSARIHWQEEISQWHGYEHVRIKTLGTLTADLEFGEHPKCWKSPNCSIEIVPDNRQTILGRDRLKELGLRMKLMDLPKKMSKYTCNSICPVFSAEQQAVALKFPDLVTRNGKSKSHAVRSTFKDD